MPVRSIQSTTDRVIIDLGSGPIELLYLGLPGQSGSNNHRDGLLDGLNALMETRINIDDLPADEEVMNPSRWSDEDMAAVYGERMFFERNGPNTFLVARAVIATGAVWDGEKYILAIRRAI